MGLLGAARLPITMLPSVLHFALLSLMVAGAAGLKCHECTMTSDDDVSCRDNPTKAYSKTCEENDNRCMTVWADYTHSRLGSYVLRRCAHSTVCNSEKPEIPELNAISLKESQTKVDCCETDNCNEEASGNLLTSSPGLLLLLCAATWLINYQL